ncbi:MAG: ABC transporter permease [Oscillospiraceae bacterium]|nr:ABC transporter permease [Oscillospiraceae bacterium]
MAKKALHKDLLREIKNTRARFLSIFLLVALAVAFLAGLRTTEPDMTKSADDYLDSTNLMDVRLLSTLGLTEDDLEAASSLEGVASAQADWEVDALVTSDDVTLVVKTISLPENDINQPYLLEGRMPEAEDECIVEESLLESLGKGIGDTLTFDTGDGDYADALARTTYTVVGTCNSPLYISTQRGTSTLGSGSISAIVYLPREAYTLDYYTTIYLTLEGALELNAYSDSYTELVEAFTDSIEDFADQRAELRTEEIRAEAQEELDEAQADYDEAKAEAEQELDDAAQELADARTELDDGWTEYNDGLETLDTETADAQTQIDDAKAELADAYTTLTESETEYEDGYAQYEDGLSQYNAGLAEYRAGLAEYESGYAQYEDGLAEYEAGYAQYQAGLAEYESGYAQYQAGLTEYEAGYAQYQAGLAAYESGYAQWQAAWAAIAAAGLEDSAEGQALLAQKAALDEIKATLDATAATLEQSKAVLDATEAQLAAAKATLDETEAQLAAAKATLDETAATLAAAKAELDTAKATLDSTAATLASSKATLAAARTELDEGWAEYYDGLEEVAEAEAELESETADAEQELADALTELSDGETEYADGLAEYEEARLDAEQELADAQQEIDDGQAEIDDLEDCTWYVLDRSSNLGFASYESDAENMGNLATMFPLIFFLVAALVCLTTMTRMVEEQRVTIGGLKALGYSRGDIARKYVGYGLIASLGGSIVGLLVGCSLIPWIIITCWKIMYSIPTVKFAFCPVIYLFSAGAAVLVIVGTVLSATLSALRATPATLMRPKTPKAGKRVLLERVTPLWKRLTFTQKVTVRNLFRYKKRFWMTVIGIGGCTALIVTGFGLRDSINDILGIQYDQLSLYNATAVIEEDDLEELEALLDENELVSGYAVVHQNSIDFEGSSTISGYYMVVDSPESVEGYMVFRHRLNHEAVELTDDGLYICEKLSELLDLEVGDTLVLSGDQRVTATVAGIVENYVYNYVYMTQSYYEALYGEAAEHNEVMISYVEDTEETENAVAQELLEAGVISSITQVSAVRSSLDDSFHTINYAVLVIIISAAALAFVVLFNLSNINITERKRELATLKVLGFNDREMNDYVLRENVILTVLGILLGLLMGKGLHAFLVKTVEIEMVMFGRSAKPVSYLMAALLTALFSVAVNILAGRSLRKIDMVESLKSVE